MTCIVCHVGSLEEITEYQNLNRITSDCRPFAAGGKMFKCHSCGAVQKKNTSEWRMECEEIYGSYDVYSVSAGLEQSVRGGGSSPVYGKRSDIVLNRAAELLDLPSCGRFLDFGCGSGVSSSAASLRLYGWAIDGFDLDRRMEGNLERIGGFENLYTGDPEKIAERYDLIMLTHVLEHVPSPIKTMELLTGLLKPSGAIIIQVPDRNSNPYDLLVADHLMHFDLRSLSLVCREAGLTALGLSDDWVIKELSLVATRISDGGEEAAKALPSVLPPEKQVAWLRSAAEFCRKNGERKTIGMFGTSLIATWMTQELGRKPDFYVDDDPAKIGQTLDGIEILSPDDVQKGSVVIPAMSDEIARLVAARHQDKEFEFIFLELD